MVLRSTALVITLLLATLVGQAQAVAVTPSSVARRASAGRLRSVAAKLRGRLHRARKKTSVRARRVARGLGRVAKRAKRALQRGTWKLRKSTLGQLAGGLFVDGPRESWAAIKAHPKTFLISLGVTGLCVLGGEALGLPMHQLLIGAGGLAAATEMWQTYRYEFKHARGRKKRARALGKMLWPPSLVGLIAVAGNSMHTSTSALSARSLSLRAAARALSRAVVTGGDVPTSTLTAYETYRDHAKH